MIVNRCPVDRRLIRSAVLVVLVFALGLDAATAQNATPPPDQVFNSFENLSGTIVADGSSTVGPITEAMAEEFSALASDVQLEVSISGTGGGFARFCNGETDLQNASREMKDEEATACEANGVDFLVFEVAYDGIAVVVNPKNTFVNCLTVEQLKLMWQPEDPATNWNQIDPAFPDQSIELYGAGTSSGTFDYFTKEIVGEEGSANTDYLPSEDDNQLVEGVAGDKDALGFFGLAYYEQNMDRLKIVSIDDGHGCVAPTTDTVRNLSYSPLSRPLFVYVNTESLQRPEVWQFMKFYIDNASEIVADVGFVAAPDQAYVDDLAELQTFWNEAGSTSKIAAWS